MNKAVDASKFLSVISVAIILFTSIPMLFVYEPLREFCICIVNFMAWSWIAFAISILISIVLILKGVYSSDETAGKFAGVLLILQSLAFVTALVFFIIFTSKIVNVID